MAGYLEQKRHFSPAHIASRILEIVEDEQAKVVDYWEEFVSMQYWLHAETFDRQVVNHRLVELIWYRAYIYEKLQKWSKIWRHKFA